MQAWQFGLMDIRKSLEVLENFYLEITSYLNGNETLILSKTRQKEY